MCVVEWYEHWSLEYVSALDLIGTAPGIVLILVLTPEIPSRGRAASPLSTNI